MGLDMQSTQRSWVYVLALAVFIAAVLWWFIPAVQNASVKGPVETQIVVRTSCLDSKLNAPYYGNRELEPMSYCAGPDR